MNGKSMITIAALALMLSAAALTAQPPAGGPGAHGIGSCARADAAGPEAARGARGPALLNPRFLTRYLDLSEQQVKEMKALFEDHREATRPIHEELRGLHRELRALLDGEDPDPGAIGRVILEGEALKTGARALREALHSDLRALLTTEQQERWNILLEIVDILRSPRRGGPPQGD